MAQHTFAGGWLRRIYEVTPAEPLHTADPRHGIPEPADASTGAWAGPPILATDPAPYLVDGGYVDDWVVDTPGAVLDLTPYDHNDGYGGANYADGPTVYASNPGDLAYQAASAHAHGSDYGSSRASSYDQPPMQAWDERYISTRFEGVGPVGDLIPTLAGGGQRGLNGLSVNNPPMDSYDGRGYRWGWIEQFMVDRKMYDGQRVHDERFNTPNVAEYEMNGTVPEDAGAYNSPFDTMARIITNVNQRPLLRRTPPPIDQSLIDDAEYAEDSPYYSDSWVVG